MSIATARSRRHREPSAVQEEQQIKTPFFTKANAANVQRKPEPFFSTSTGLVQAKLTIGQPGDKYEQEADAVADAVVNQSSSSGAAVAQRKEISGIQRATLASPAEDEKLLSTAEGRMEKDKLIQNKPMEEEEPVQMMAEEEEEPVQMMAEEEEEEPIQMMAEEEEEPVQMMAKEEEEPIQAKSDGGTTASAALSSQLSSTKGKGRALSPKTRGEMESAIGADFSGVNVHTDNESVGMNEALRAQAFTNGSDVYFNAGKYQPESTEGKRLLAHELTHVVQQNGSGTPKGGAAHEREKPGGGRGGNTPSIQRACGNDAATVGSTGCTFESSDPVGERVFFNSNCDTFKNALEIEKTNAFADSMTSTDTVKVHGFSSMDGPADFNEKLSCARAKRAASVLTSKGINPANIEIIAHGEQPGPAATMRSVVLELGGGVSRPTVPQLVPTVVTAPTAGTCGSNVNYVIQWDLSRNAGAQGGFIIQDVTFTWVVVDCNGNIATHPVFSSPLHYFEAWRVLPNSRTFDAADGATDTFAWFGNPPHGGGGTDGFVIVSATAQYHDDVPVGSMPGHMVRNNPATFAGGLRSSLNNPNLGGNLSRQLPHNLMVDWTCCPPSSSPTNIIFHTP